MLNYFKHLPTVFGLVEDQNNELADLNNSTASDYES